LVEEIVPDFVDPESDGPLPGREEEWGVVTGYRVLLAREERQWAKAERLQAFCVDWGRQLAAPALARPAGDLESGEQNAIRTFAASLHSLGQIRRELGRADCVPAYEEALEFSERIAERAGAAICAFNLGHAFKDLPALRDLDQTEHWYRRSLELRDERDRLGRGRCAVQLGTVASERFHDALEAGGSSEELLRYLNEAAGHYHEALILIPADAVNDLAVTHNQLGGIYFRAGDFDRAMQHCRQSIQFKEQTGDLYGASVTRFNAALALLDAGRQADALEYAEAALRGFEPYGAGAAEEIKRARGLIVELRGT
jgi:tetratricopeptide (TPR) repeat protein